MAAKGMKGLLAWCKKNTEGYRDVNVTNMSSSWKDGLAFCALLHKFHPELIDFNSLSKENVLYNNNLAFGIAEELGIAPFLDAEDMANMKVPDRLSVMTYLSQYYNYFKDCKPVEPSGQHVVVNPVNQTKPLDSTKKSNDENVCHICGKKVHLVQRYLEDGKLYHRTCHRNSSLDKIRGKNYFIHRESNEKATNAVTDLAGGKSNPQVMALPKIDAVGGLKEAQPPKVGANRLDVKDVPTKGEKHKGPVIQKELSDESNKTTIPLPKPRVKTLPTSAKTVGKTKVVEASQSSSDEDYDDTLNPFGSDSEDEDTLSSTSSEEDTNPFGSSTGTTNVPKCENEVAIKQESESEIEGNPFGDDDIDEVESEGYGNPFGEDNDEDESSPSTEAKPRRSERFNPFSKESINEETAASKSKGALKKAPPRPPSLPAQKALPKSHKKAPAPPPPTRKNETTEKMVKMNRENERDARFPQAKSVRIYQRPLSPKSPSQKMDRFKLRRLSTPKTRAAPGYGHPLVKRKVHITMTEEEITTELKVLDIKLTDYETKGVKLEEMLRYAMNKEVEWTREEDELLNEWFDLVNKKNILLRDESDLVFQLQQQKLEQEHADIEFELRKLLNKPDSAKTEKDKQDEEELLQKLVEVVERRNVIINSIEEERVKEAEEDSMYEQMQWMRNHPSKKKKKNKVKKMFSKKEKKGKKEKESDHS